MANTKETVKASKPVEAPKVTDCIKCGKKTAECTCLKDKNGRLIW